MLRNPGGLIGLVITSLVLNIVIAFLHDLPPGFLVSVTDAVAAIIVAMVLFFPELSIAQANLATIVGFMILGSFSLVGIAGMSNLGGD